MIRIMTPECACCSFEMPRQFESFGRNILSSLQPCVTKLAVITGSTARRIYDSRQHRAVTSKVNSLLLGALE